MREGNVRMRLSSLVCGAVLAGTLASGLAARADESSTVTDVKIERVRPNHPKYETLKFLRENRDFIRGRYDALREKEVTRRVAAAEIDPRFLAYRDLLADVLAAKDSVASAEEARRRLDLLRSITQLGDLEAQLDVMDHLLFEQRRRLGVLQADFVGDQRTALMVVASGFPAGAAPTEVRITIDDGTPLTIPLSPEQSASLAHGGVVQLFHGFVEPREQVVEVDLGGESWPQGDTGFLTLEPARDRLTLLRLDLSAVQKDAGAPGIRASTWLHDAKLPSGDG